MSLDASPNMYVLAQNRMSHPSICIGELLASQGHMLMPTKSRAGCFLDILRGSDVVIYTWLYIIVHQILLLTSDSANFSFSTHRVVSLL